MSEERNEENKERVVFARRHTKPASEVKTVRPPRRPNMKCCGRWSHRARPWCFSCLCQQRW